MTTIFFGCGGFTASWGASTASRVAKSSQAAFSAVDGAVQRSWGREAIYFAV
jgi:hypothetical protein